MGDNVIVVARRESGQNDLTTSLSTLGLFTVFLVTDIVFYIKDKFIWELVLLIISAILFGLALIFFLFTLSNYGYSKKIIDKPLITFDNEKKTFKVIDCIFHKDVEIEKEDVIEVKISDKGESYLWYKKGDKNDSIFIGYSYKSSEDLINNEMLKYKNLYEGE